MKIAFISEHFKPQYGGQEVYMRDFSEYLIQQGHEINFFTQSSNVENPDLDINIINMPSCSKWMRWVQWWYFLKQVKKQLQDKDFDVVMGTGVCADVNVYQPHGGVRKASHRQNRLLTGTVQCFFKGLSNLLSPKHIMVSKIEQDIFDQSQAQFIAISKMVAGHMKEFYAVKDSQLTLIYNGVDVERFKPCSALEKEQARKNLGIDDGRVLMSLVAHNFKLKGLKELLQALCELKKSQKDFLLVVAGKGKQKKYLSQITKLGLQKHVRFLGSVDNPEDIYRASDIYLQPTWYDPCSLVVLEAMAAGLPVLTTEFNGAAELMEHGKSGFVIDRPDNQQAFVKALEAMMSIDKRKSVAQAAREKIEPFTHLRNYQLMEKVFEKVQG